MGKKLSGQVKNTLSDRTAIIHDDYVAPAGFDAFPVAIQQASTVLFPDVATMRTRRWQQKTGYTYGLHGTPTTFTLEARLATIEGGQHCRLAPSGLAAITMVNIALLQAGDDVLVPETAYGPNKDQLAWFARFGIQARCYDPMVGAGIAELIADNTRLIWVESPGSVTMEVQDIPAICAAAKAKGVCVAMDNTWSAGVYFKPFAHGVDISVQALTKYQSGGSDVLSGAVITNDDVLNSKIETAHMHLGYGVGMHDVYQILRSLDTMPVRLAAHDASARQVATWLSSRPEITTILHPAFEDCPGHAVWERDFTGAGGLFSVIFDPSYTEEQTDRFVDSLNLFDIGYSWGGAHSLCMPYRMQSMRANWSHKGQLVRFNIGLESAEDLIADIAQALARL